MKTKNIAMILTLALTAGLCQTAAPSQAATPKLSTKNLTMKVGKTAALKVKKTSKKAKWSIVSGKKNIRLTAKKKTSVKVKAVKVGKAKISCKIGKKKLVCKVTVYGPIPPCVIPTQSPAVTASAAPTQQPTQSPTVVPTSTPTQTPETTKVPVRTHEPTENRIMAEPAKYTELPSEDENGNPISYADGGKIYYFFGTEISRGKIEKLSIETSCKVPEEVLGSMDLSEKQNGSVMAWYTDIDNNGRYEMTIGQDGGVVANPNSSYLFCDLDLVTGLDNLYTTGVTDMSNMFRNYSLKGQDLLDLGDDFDTSSVKKMNGMFANFGITAKKSNLRLGKAFSFESIEEVPVLVSYGVMVTSYGTVYVSSEKVKDYIVNALNGPSLVMYHDVVLQD